jgi:perosamine synthetase
MNTSQINTISEGLLSTEQIVATISSVLEELNVPRTLHQPLFQGHEWEYLKDCIDTGWVSSVGSYVDRIEQMLAEYTGAKRAVAVVNGTAALFIALKMAGVEPGDEVLIPALTFVATANAVAYCGATPHFVDSEYATLGIDPAKLDHYLGDIGAVDSDGTRNRFTGARIKAVVPMHTFGHPVDLDPLMELCHRWKLEMIEDAAESLGSFYKERHTGTFGRIGILSFNGNKIVTSGGGGALLFNNEAEAKLAKHLTTTARKPHKWEYFHDMLGYNFRMPNLNAALGCAQLENLPGFLERKRKLALQYVKAFKNITGVKVVKEPSFAHSNYWLNALLLDEGVASQRDTLLEATNASGIMTRPAWILMHHLPMYEKCPRMDLSVAESLEKRIVNIPSSVSRICS